MSKIKKAILLAAGEGKRLRPVTVDIPKPLIKVNGTRITDTIIDSLYFNGIREIYIVTGYKKELFYELYGNTQGIHIIENPDYLSGNNIISMYYVKDLLPESFVIESDIIINDPGVLFPDIEQSGYLTSFGRVDNEWELQVKEANVTGCYKDAKGEGLRVWGISMWNKTDGKRLSEIIENEYIMGNHNIFWDELPLFKYRDEFNLCVREVKSDSLLEIDTFYELVRIDGSYKEYRTYSY